MSVPANYFEIDEREKVAVFIDGTALYRACRSCGYSPDFKSLFEAMYCRDKSGPVNYIIGINYYSLLYKPTGNGSAGNAKALEWLGFNGVNVVSKEKVEGYTNGERSMFGSFAVEMTIDALTVSKVADHFIFCVSEPVYVPLFQRLRQEGKRVTLLTTLNKNDAHRFEEGPHVTFEMRQSVSKLIDLSADMSGLIQMIGKA